MMKTTQIADGKGGFAIPPMHGVVYNLTSTLQKNDKGSWYGWVNYTRTELWDKKDKGFVQISAKEFSSNASRTEPCKQKLM